MGGDAPPDPQVPGGPCGPADPDGPISPGPDAAPDDPPGEDWVPPLPLAEEPPERVAPVARVAAPAAPAITPAPDPAEPVTCDTAGAISFMNAGRVRIATANIAKPASAMIGAVAAPPASLPMTQNAVA